MMSLSRWLPAVLLTIASTLLPLAVVVERTESAAWQQRLWLPTAAAEPARHTPQFSVGTFLPTTLNGTTVLTPEHNPVIIPRPTELLPGATLLLAAGTQLYFHEFAYLEINGTFTVAGTAEAPVRLASNEQHPDNQLWGGLQFGPAAVGTIEHATFTAASPAITCLPESRVAVSNTRIAAGTLGMYTESPDCTIQASRITGPARGVIGRGVSPQLSDTTITVGSPTAATATF